MIFFFSSSLVPLNSSLLSHNATLFRANFPLFFRFSLSFFCRLHFSIGLLLFVGWSHPNRIPNNAWKTSSFFATAWAIRSIVFCCTFVYILSVCISNCTSYPSVHARTRETERKRQFESNFCVCKKKEKIVTAHGFEVMIGSDHCVPFCLSLSTLHMRNNVRRDRNRRTSVTIFICLNVFSSYLLFIHQNYTFLTCLTNETMILLSRWHLLIFILKMCKNETTKSEDKRKEWQNPQWDRISFLRLQFHNRGWNEQHE